MNLSEIDIGTSLKYDYPAIGKQGAYTLVGIFVELPNRYRKDNGNYSQKPGLFLGYIKGSSQFKKLKVYFYNSDKEATDSWENVISHDSISMNINRLSATKMPKKVSDYLKALHKQYQAENKRQEEIKRLEAQSSKAYDKISTLSKNIVESLQNDPEYKPDYKNMSDENFYLEAKQLFSKSKHKHVIKDVYVDKITNVVSLNIELELKDRYNPDSFVEYENYGPHYDYARSYKTTFEQLTSRDKLILDKINTPLLGIKDLKINIYLEFGDGIDDMGHIIALYKININDKSNLDSTIEQIGKIF
jgi:hypothetical protein